MANEPPRHPVETRMKERFGRYIVEEALAEGAMGHVYRARDPETDRNVAIKVLRRDLSQDRVAVERFHREYETAKSLVHPRVVGVEDFGQTEDGRYFMTMEYLRGESLSAALAREGGLAPERTIRIVCQLATGLHHAHQHGVVHRDLKPDNVFVSQEAGGDAVRIVDFGSVKLQVASGPKLTALGTTLGSPYYMSPEQAMGKLDLDPRTDVFALAAIAYELATGHVAFGGEDVAEILMKILSAEPPPVSASNPLYPWDFDDVIKKGLNKDKEHRYRSVVELAEAILRAFGLDAEVDRWARAPISEVADALQDGDLSQEVRSLPPLAYPTSVPPPPPRPAPRGKIVALAMAVGVIAAAVWTFLR